MVTPEYFQRLAKRAKRWLTTAVLDDGMDAESYEPAPATTTNAILGSEAGIASVLKYDIFDPKNGLFFNDNTIGFMFELMPQTGADDNTCARLQSLYTSAPAKVGIQFCLTGLPDSDPMFERYVNLRRAGEYRGEENTELYTELALNHVRHLRRGSFRPMWEGDPFLVKNFRLIMSVVLPGTKEDVDVVSRLLILRESYRQSLRTAGYPAVDMDADDFINWIFPIINPTRLFDGGERPRLNYDDGRSLRGQVREPNLAKQRYDKMEFGPKENTVEVRTYSVMSYPKKTELWEMGSLIGDFYDVALQYPCPFMITMGVFTLEFDNVKQKAMMKAARAQQNAESQMAKIQPELAQQNQDWKIVTKRVDEGHSMCELYHQLTLFSPPDRMESAESAAIAIWRSKGFTIVRDYFHQLGSLVVSLPMTLTPGIRSDMRKLEKISSKTSDNAINMAPMLAEWKGIGDEVMMMVGRRGQPTFLDFYANTAGNYNVAVTGVSGSGKSVAMQYIMQSYRSVGSKGWIIDVGRSYEKMVYVNGGEFIEFRTEDPICINPFSWVTNLKEDMKLLKPWASRMAQAQNPYERELIALAIGHSYENERENANITHVQQFLMTKCKTANGLADEVAYRLGMQLTSFSKNGMYGDFFNGHATVSMKGDLVALEMEELKSAPDLLQAVLFVVMNRITFEMYLSRTQRKTAMLDEAWQLLGDDSESALFIEEGYRRARKYDGCFISGTQGIGDYFKNEAAQAAYVNADFKIYLRQDQDVMKSLKAKGQLSLDPVLERMIASLQKEDGKFSEMVIRSPMGSGVARLILDPYFMELTSTKAADFVAFQELRKSGVSTSDAIYNIMRRKEMAYA